MLVTKPTLLPRRKILTAGLGLGSLALAAPNAFANQPFTTYAFAATGAPTQRTMPDRLNEIKNVLDFGADPTGAADSQPAIQAAVDSVSGANRGTIYFPLGFYSVHSPITFNYNGNLSICFRGEGIGSTIAGNFNGFIFDRHLATPNNLAKVVFDKMAVQNADQTAGGGSGGVRLGSTAGAYIRDSAFSGFVGFTTEDSAGNSSQNILIEDCKFQTSAPTLGTALIVGGSGAIFGSDFVGSSIGMVLYGGGFYIAGCRNENCGIGYQLGLDSAGNNVGLSGFSLTSCSNEGNITGIDMAGLCSGGYISVTFLGHPTSGPNEAAPTQYGLRVRAGCARSCVFSIGAQSTFDVAGISIANASSRANNVFIGCISVVGNGTGVPWIMPTNAYTAKFIENNAQPIWTFSQLPSGAGNVFEGDEYNISDSNTATWGATAAGSGSNHALVRWNGTNWTVVGV